MTTTMTLTDGRTLIAGCRDGMITHLMHDPGLPLGEATAATDQLYDRCAARISEEKGWDAGSAREAVDRGLAFLARTERGISPNEIEDEGWHTLILYTAEYAALCHCLHGRFIHHRPNDIDGMIRTREGKCGGNPPCGKCDD